MFQLIDFLKTDFKRAYQQGKARIDEALRGVCTSSDAFQQYESAEAAQKLVEAMEAIEKELAGVCAQHTRTYWLMLLRRLHVADTYGGDFPQTGVNYQATAELAAVKYGRSGYSDLFSKELPLPDLSDEPSIKDNDPDRTYAALKRRTISPPVHREDFYALIAIHRLATCYYSLTATYRRVGKGSILEIKNQVEWDASAPPELERVIALYDTRLETSESDLLASLGLSYVLNKESILPSVDHLMAFCLLGPQRKNKDTGSLHAIFGDIRVLVPESEFRYLPAFINLNTVEQAISFSKQDFEKMHGLPWEVWACFLTAHAWHVLGELQESTAAFKVATFIRRGFMLTAEASLKNIFEVGAKVVYNKFYPGDLISDADWDRYRRIFLDMATVDAAAINLHSMRPHRFLLDDGDSILVDYAQVIHFIRDCLALRVSDHVRDQKASFAEEFFENDVVKRTSLSPCYPRNKKFKFGKRVLGEADLSFRIGSVYVPIDIKAYLVTVEFDRGDYKAVRNRWAYVQEWVEQADTLAQTLHDTPKGSNYDLIADGITHILPVVCSPFHEYVAETDSPYMLSDNIPRVATPAEIAQFLTNSTEQSLKTHPCTVSLS